MTPVLIILACISVGVSPMSIDAMNAWSQFKRENNLNNLTASDEANRLQVFLDLKKIVDAHNALFEKGLFRYELNINEFIDSMNTDLGILFNGLKDISAQYSNKKLPDPRLVSLVNKVSWLKYKHKYNKHYPTKDEDRKHFEIFLRNKEEIEKHNKLYKQGLSTYKKGVNQFTDWTQDDLNKLHRQNKSAEQTSEDIKAWDEFKHTFNKTYSPEEEAKRLEIFLKNKKEIDDHNKLYQEGLSTYEMGINKFSDWTPEELEKLNGLNPIDKSSEEDLKAWEDFKQKFNKTYSAEEETKRFDIFLKNKKEIDDHNKLYKEGLSTFEMGINKFSDWTPEELEKLNGFNPVDRPSEQDLKAWEDFKQKFNKSYSPEEESKRFDIFFKNKKEIDDHNRLYQEGLSTYEMGINKFSDWTPEELEKLNGFNPVDRPSEQDLKAWEDFKQKFNKTYSPEEESKRFDVFLKNKKEIDDHNKLYKEGLSTYEMGINKFSDWTPEKLKKLNGFNPIDRPSEQDLKAWEDFKQKFKKTYSPEEETKRFDIFLKNKKEIDDHNKLYKEGLSTYEMGINKFSDWTPQELKKLNGLNPVNRPSEQDLKAWEDFKYDYFKNYPTKDVELKRKSIFLDNKKLIDKNNELFKQGLAPSPLTINYFADYTYDELMTVLGRRGLMA